MNKVELTNLYIAELLRKVSAAYLILGENRFKIIAFNRVADSLSQLTRDLRDCWKEGTLHDIPGVGPGIAGYIDELFKTGKVKHFEEILGKLPASIYPLLQVPGIGPKKSYKLVSELKLTDEKTVIDTLLDKAISGKVALLDGFGEKSQEDIVNAIGTYKNGAIKENRMLLSTADEIVQDVFRHMKTLGDIILKIDVLGSLRRRVSTIGDIDIAVSTTRPDEVIEHFITYPHKSLTEKGPSGATLLLHNGRQVDLRVQKPKAYGAMLQYFTGSKNHNIKLRSFALSRGLSLNEYGIKIVGKTQSSRLTGESPKEATKFNIQSEKLIICATEEEFYKQIGLAWIPPELREDKGEVEAGEDMLPKLIELPDIKGDLHIHTCYDIKSSHDVGSNPLPDYLDKAASLGYEYIGLSDHNPSVTNQTEKQIVGIMKRRKEDYEQLYSSWKNKTNKRVQIFLMCEIDILSNGTLALPEEAFEYIDAAIVSLHSSFTQEKSIITKRVLKALTAHPKVRIFGHPTGRLLTKRDGADLGWKEIFAVCKERDIALEINAYPDRLDLPDFVAYDAIKQGIGCMINTDAHAIGHMDLVHYGVSVARRAWATKDDILNTMEYTKFRKWLMKGE